MYMILFPIFSHRTLYIFHKPHTYPCVTKYSDLKVGLYPPQNLYLVLQNHILNIMPQYVMYIRCSLHLVTCATVFLLFQNMFTFTFTCL